MASKADETELVVLPAAHLAKRDDPVMWIGRKRGEPRFFLNQARWSLWGKYGRAPLVDIILLSVDLDPETEPRTKVEAIDKIQLFESVLDAENVRRLDWRRRIVMSSVEDLRFADGDTGGLASAVRLSDFREFADAKGLQVPRGFPPLSRSAEGHQSGRGGVSVDLPHTTRDLDALFEIIREHWGDPSKPPKADAVGSAIDKAMGWKSPDNTPSRTAQSIAGMIRPDSFAEADKRSRRRKKP